MNTRERFKRAEPMAELRHRVSEELYGVPDPMRSEEEWMRHTHEDLAGRGLPELRFELERLQLRLILDDSPDPWLLGRMQVLRGAIADARR